MKETSTKQPSSNNLGKCNEVLKETKRLSWRVELFMSRAAKHKLFVDVWNHLQEMPDFESQIINKYGFVIFNLICELVNVDQIFCFKVLLTIIYFSFSCQLFCHQFIHSPFIACHLEMTFHITNYVWSIDYLWLQFEPSILKQNRYIQWPKIQSI